MNKKLAESIHSLLAFSASPRWIPCPGSMAYPENTAEGVDGGFFANKGTASHEIASACLKDKSEAVKAADWIGKSMKVGKDTIEVDETMASYVQTYVDDVRRRAIGGYLMVEQRVSLADVEGFDETNYGTSDAVIAIEAKRHAEGSMPTYGVVEDLKSGQGEKVYAWETAKKDAPFTMTFYPEDDEGEGVEVVPNYQLMMYALASLSTFEILVGPVAFVRIVINQPPLGSIQELDVPIAVLERFALFAANAKDRAETALGLGVKAIEEYPKQWLKPGDKQCRWCRAQARCPALQAHLQDEIGAEFDMIDENAKPAVPMDVTRLARAYRVLPLLAGWSKAVAAKVHEEVNAGSKVIGADGRPMKFVEGKQDDRKWSDEAKAEALLVGQLGPKAYAPQKVLTAPAASKLLDKKATKELWTKTFVPLIKRAPGRAVLALGSDSRPPFSGVADASEFEGVDE